MYLSSDNRSIPRPIYGPLKNRCGTRNPCAAAIACTSDTSDTFFGKFRCRDFFGQKENRTRRVSRRRRGTCFLLQHLSQKVGEVWKVSEVPAAQGFLAPHLLPHFDPRYRRCGTACCPVLGSWEAARTPLGRVVCFGPWAEPPSSIPKFSTRSGTALQCLQIGGHA